MSYEEDRTWSDRFIPTIKRILAEFVLVENTHFDLKYATDMMVIELKSVSISCRIRRSKYAVKYGNEFTMRLRRSSGMKTEWHKVMCDGYCDWFFYGFEKSDGSSEIAPWHLIDLSALRRVWESSDRTKLDFDDIQMTFESFRSFVINDFVLKNIIKARSIH